MSTNEFDKLLAEKAEQATFAYEPDDWEALSKQLAAARRKKRAALFAYTVSGMAACAAIVLFMLVATGSKKEMPVVHTTPASSITPKTAPITPNISTAPVSTVPSSSSVMGTGASIALQAHHNHAAIGKSIVAHTATDNSQSSVASTNTPATDTRSNIDTHTTPGAADTAAAQTQKTAPEETAGIWPNMIPPERVKNRINISVGGGVNYGTLNTGYALTAMADRKLGNKFSVEVAVGYVSNNSTMSAPGIPFSTVTSKPPPPVFLPLNYLQFAPVAGYGLSPKLTIAAGADMERLLLDHDATITYNDKPKIAPTFDMGLLLKTDYAVTNRLKAGISYRIGANNLLSAGNNYIDRNYMQVQLKYRLH